MTMWIIVINTENVGDVGGDATEVVGPFSQEEDAIIHLCGYVDRHSDLEIMRNQLTDAGLLDTRDQEGGRVCFYVREVGKHKRVDRVLPYAED